MKLTKQEENILCNVPKEMLNNKKPKDFCVIVGSLYTNNIVSIIKFTNFRKTIKKVPDAYNDTDIFTYTLENLG